MAIGTRVILGAFSLLCSNFVVAGTMWLEPLPANGDIKVSWLQADSPCTGSEASCELLNYQIFVEVPNSTDPMYARRNLVYQGYGEFFHYRPKVIGNHEFSVFSNWQKCTSSGNGDEICTTETHQLDGSGSFPNSGLDNKFNVDHALSDPPDVSQYDVSEMSSTPNSDNPRSALNGAFSAFQLPNNPAIQLAWNQSANNPCATTDVAVALCDIRKYRLEITPPQGPIERKQFDYETESYEFKPEYYGLYKFELSVEWRRCVLTGGFSRKCSLSESSYGGITGVYYTDYGMQETDSDRSASQQSSQKSSSADSEGSSSPDSSPSLGTNGSDDVKAKNDAWATENSWKSRKDAPECPLPKPKLFYINGMNTALGAATDSQPRASGATQQAARIQELFPDYDVELLYVEHQSLMLDTVEVLGQKINEECDLAQSTKGSKDLFELMWKGTLSRSDQDPLSENNQRFDASYCNGKSIANLETEARALAWSRTINSQPDLGTHYTRYQEYAARNEPYTVIGYSQGSLYAAYGYEAILTQYPEMSDRIAVFMVGAAASHNPSPVGAEQDEEVVATHLTFKKDRVINFLRTIRDTLTPNFDYVPGDEHNHGFSQYFGPSHPTSYTKIAERVNILTGIMPERECSEPETDVIECEQAVRVGGSGDETHFLNLGNQPGNVRIEFEAYNVKDGVNVTDRSGRTIFTTNGQVSGHHETNYRFKGTGNNTGEILTADVDANSDPNTAWALNMFCPGEYQNDRETLFFSYRASSQINNQFKCSIRAWVDGQLIHDSGKNKSTQISFQAELRPGTHSYEYEASCESINASGCGGAGRPCQTWDDSGISRKDGQSSGKFVSLPDPVYRPKGSILFSH